MEQLEGMGSLVAGLANMDLTEDNGEDVVEQEDTDKYKTLTNLAWNRRDYRLSHENCYNTNGTATLPNFLTVRLHKAPVEIKGSGKAGLGGAAGADTTPNKNNTWWAKYDLCYRMPSTEILSASVVVVDGCLINGTLRPKAPTYGVEYVQIGIPIAVFHALAGNIVEASGGYTILLPKFQIHNNQIYVWMNVNIEKGALMIMGSETTRTEIKAGEGPQNLVDWNKRGSTVEDWFKGRDIDEVDNETLLDVAVGLEPTITGQVPAGSRPDHMVNFKYNLKLKITKVILCQELEFTPKNKPPPLKDITRF